MKFEEVYNVDISENVEKKNTQKPEKKKDLIYLSWAHAWREIKKIYPDVTFEIKKFDGGLPYVHDEDTGYMVFTSMTINGITHEMCLPVLDNRNQAKRKGNCTMFDINKSIMRCLAKNIALFGLGLNLYCGEDLIDAEEYRCEKCNKLFYDLVTKSGEVYTAKEVYEKSKEANGKALCSACVKGEKNE